MSTLQAVTQRYTSKRPFPLPLHLPYLNRYARRVPETLPQSVLQKMPAAPKPDYPIITPDILATYNGFLFGIPTPYGNFPAQWKAFWDSTGRWWSTGALTGKYAEVFVALATQGGNLLELPRSPWDCSRAIGGTSPRSPS